MSSMSFFGRWIVTTIAVAVAAVLVPGFETVGGGFIGPLAFALVLALVNVTIKPLAQALSIPLTIVTLGIFYVVVNALLLELASFLSRGLFHAGIYIASFGSAFAAAVVISLVSLLLGGLGD